MVRPDLTFAVDFDVKYEESKFSFAFSQEPQDSLVFGPVVAPPLLPSSFALSGLKTLTN